MINEAVGIYADGVASAEGIDAAMKLGANHPMGPLALGDLVGLDICLAIMEVLYMRLVIRNIVHIHYFVKWFVAET